MWGGDGGWGGGMKGKAKGYGIVKGDFGKGCFGKGKDKGKDGKDAKGSGKSKCAMKLAAGEPIYHGQIKTYDVDRKRGYIVCQEVNCMTGGDVYVFENVLAESGAGPGDTVAFFLHWSASSGQPQASAPMIRIAAAEGDFALKGIFKPGGEGKDHGFLVCDTTKEFFGRDVYVNKDLAATLEPGASVAFNVYLNKDKMPNVQSQGDIPGSAVCDADWEPTPGDISTTRTDPSVVSKGKGKDKGKDGGWDKGKGKGGKDMWGMMSSQMANWGKGGGKDGGWDGGWGGDAWGGGKGKAKGESGPPPAATGETFVGIIKSFNEKTNYGFIACDEVKAKYGGDCFCNGRHLEGHAVGEMIEFDVGVNKGGQPQVLSMRPLSEDPAAKRPRLM